MKATTHRYESAKEFALDLGLSEIEAVLIQAKKTVIKKLKAKRKQKGLSQAAVAKMVGSKQPAIARMESGQVSEVSMDFLANVALALRVSIAIKPEKKAA